MARPLIHSSFRFRRRFRRLALPAMAFPLAAMLLVPPVSAQPPGGERRDGDRGRNRGRGGPPMIMHRGPGGGPPPMMMGPPGRHDRGAMGERMIGMIRSMDANRDGKFELKELPEHRRRFAKMMLERSGFDTEKAIDLKKIEQKVRERFGGGGGNNEDGEPPLVPGFGLASEGTPPPTFGTRVETEEEQNRDEERRRRHEQRRRQDQQRKIEAFAKSMMEKGDRNKNRLLEKHLDEWDAVRGDPEEMDRNNDKRLTLNELIVGMNGRPVPDSSPFPKGAFRFLSYYDRLPEGVPDWFLERDQNKNAQLEMNEYTDDWNRAAAEEFTFLDRNNDGVVTVEECFTTLREVEEREEEQSEERPQNSDGPPQMADGPRPGRVPSNGESVRPRVIHREEGAKQVIVRPSGGPGGDGDRNSRGR